MVFWSEQETRPESLSHWLPWAGFVAEGVVMNKDGSLQRSYHYRGPDLESAIPSELYSLATALNRIYMQFGSGYALYFDAELLPSNEFPIRFTPDPVTFLAQTERRAQFEDREFYDPNFTLTVVWLPPKNTEKKVSRYFLKKEGGKDKTQNDIQKEFIETTNRILDPLTTLLKEFRPLTTNETFTYYNRLVSGECFSVLPPPDKFYLDCHLGNLYAETGFTPVLGEDKLAVITLSGFAPVVDPGIFDDLLHLPFPVRWNTRFLCLDQEEAKRELNKYRRKLAQGKDSFQDRINDIAGGANSNRQPNFDAVFDYTTTETALQNLASGIEGLGYYSFTILIRDKDEQALDEKVREVQKHIQRRQFKARKEKGLAFDAFLGTLPGGCRHNIRAPLLSTRALVRATPVNQPWPGDKTNPTTGEPALFYAISGTAGRFRYSDYNDDTQNSVTVGPTGAGKSFFINMHVLSFLSHKDSQVFLFDVGGSPRALCTGLGASYNDLSDKNGTRLQPLAQIDDLSERRWAQEWCLDVITDELTREVNTYDKEKIWGALSTLSTFPKHQRTLSGLQMCLQDEELRAAFSDYVVTGAAGEILDSDSDSLEDSRFQVFELEGLLTERARMVPHVVSYLFHRIRQKLTGQKSRIIFDEGHRYLDNAVFAPRLRRLLKEMRKYNTGVKIATQSLEDFRNSSIYSTVKDCCPVRNWLPNADALNGTSRELYQDWGLNEAQIEIISMMQRQRHYYYDSPKGNRIFELCPREIVLAYCGATSKAAQKEIIDIRDKCSSTLEFNIQYLKKRGVTWAVDWLEQFQASQVQNAA